MRHLYPALLVPVLFFTTPSAHPQDPVTVDPTIAKVEFENDRIRVLRVHYGPHQKLAMHEHPAKIAVCLANFHMHRVAPDGTSSEGTCPAGSVTWREPERHAVDNLDNAPAETIEIELKYAHAQATAAPPTSASSDPLEIDLEPHHHVVLRNQYVKVMDVRIDPGDTTNFHTHAHDTVFVRLSDSEIQQQGPKDKEWEPPHPSKYGQVNFDDDSQHPFTHRVKNIGTTPFRVLDIELLQ